MSFIDDVMSGEASLNDFDDYVDRWHDSIEITDSIMLHDYLGFTWSEYIVGFRNPQKWETVVEARKLL